MSAADWLCTVWTVRAPSILLVVIAVATLLLGGAAGASAHAVLDRAEPRPGSRVRMSPTQVRLSFTERIEPAYSTIQVVDEAGRRVDRDDAQVDAPPATLLRVSVEPLRPGRYTVIWRVLSVDAHLTAGDFTFTVAP